MARASAQDWVTAWALVSGSESGLELVLVMVMGLERALAVLELVLLLASASVPNWP